MLLKYLITNCVVDAKCPLYQHVTCLKSPQWILYMKNLFLICDHINNLRGETLFMKLLVFLTTAFENF